MRKQDLNHLSLHDLDLLVALRQNAERITQQMPEEDKPYALDEAYTWRYDNIYNGTERH